MEAPVLPRRHAARSSSIKRSGASDYSFGLEEEFFVVERRSGGPTDRALIEENLWRALRYGTRAALIDLQTRRARTFRAQLTSILQLIADDATALACECEVEHVRGKMMARGTSAHLQLAVYHTARSKGRPHKAALRDVVGWLRRSTETGELLGSDESDETVSAADMRRSA